MMIGSSEQSPSVVITLLALQLILPVAISEWITHIKEKVIC